jgi:hypothetical protein
LPARSGAPGRVTASHRPARSDRGTGRRATGAGAGADATVARAAMRTAGGWLQAPHGDHDFEGTLRVWETGVCGDGTQHFVAARCAAFGRGRGRVDVARCKDCGLPIYRTGGDPGENDTIGWRPIWP